MFIARQCRRQIKTLMQEKVSLEENYKKKLVELQEKINKMKTGM